MRTDPAGDERAKPESDLELSQKVQQALLLLRKIRDILNNALDEAS